MGTGFVDEAGGGATTEAGLEDAGDEAVGGAGVVGVDGAEGLVEGGFFDADAIEESGGGADEDDGKADEIAGVEADAEEDKDEAEVGGMADEAVQAALVDLLVWADGDIDREGAAEGKDGDPANGETGEEQEDGEGDEPGGAVEVGGGKVSGAPAGGGDAGGDSDPE